MIDSKWKDGDFLKNFERAIYYDLIFGWTDLLPCEISIGQSILFTNPSARAGYDIRSIFKRSLAGLISEFSFS